MQRKRAVEIIYGGKKNEKNAIKGDLRLFYI